VGIADTASMSTSLICARSFEFAARVVRLTQQMSEADSASRHFATQLIRCGTSIGANAEEAQEAQSRPDFIARLSVSRREAREANYWLRLAVRSGLVTKERVAWELDESSQLLAMIRSAILTARQRAKTR
jgi:four helix bundle protein